MNNQIQRIYGYLRYWGYVENQYEFSQRWLGQCRSFYSSMKARNASPSVEALLVLLARLREHGERLNTCSGLHSNGSLQQIQMMMQREADALAERLYEGSLARVAARYANRMEPIQ